MSNGDITILICLVVISSIGVAVFTLKPIGQFLIMKIIPSLAVIILALSVMLILLLVFFFTADKANELIGFIWRN